MAELDTYLGVENPDGREATPVATPAEPRTPVEPTTPGQPSPRTRKNVHVGSLLNIIDEWTDLINDEETCNFADVARKMGIELAMIETCFMYKSFLERQGMLAWVSDPQFQNMVLNRATFNLMESKVTTSGFIHRFGGYLRGQCFLPSCMPSM